MAAPTLEAQLDESANLYYAAPPFDAALKGFESVKATLLYAQELGYARTKTAKDHSLYKRGSLINLGILIVPQVTYRKILIINPLDNLGEGFPAQAAEVEKAVAAHRSGQPFTPADNFVQKYLDLAHSKYSKDETIYPLEKGDIKPLITKRFLHDPRAVWLFKKKAGDIGEYLNEAGVRHIQFHTYADWWIDMNRKVFFNFIYMGGLEDEFQLIGHAGLHQAGSRGIAGCFKEKTEQRNYLKEKLAKGLEAVAQGDKVLLRAEHEGKIITFAHPCFGPAPFWELDARLKSKNLRWPTFSELISLIYAGWHHPLYAVEIKKMLGENGLAGLTGILYTSHHGAFVQDRLKIENKWILMASSELVEKAAAGDLSVRRVNAGLFSGRLQTYELAKNELMLALAGSGEGAQKAAEIAGMHQSLPSLSSFLGSDSGNMICLPALATDQNGNSLAVVCDNPNINRPVCTYGLLEEK